MKPAIQIKELGKKYPIRVRQPYLSLREVIVNPFKYRFPSRTEKKEIWALQDISLDIEVGDRLGIVGKNGAGKSTLLKILGRITSPSKGTATIRGRLASLLEVGTGFHPELTGRENIYLNGVILGVKAREIDKKFDSIVDFSGVEMYLDTPLKKYSTGMQLRLAFAVAAHLDPDILLIDEVLAVGDAEFQNKCIAKIKDLNNDLGRTIILVSHNMNHISSICNKGLLLDNGKITETGTANNVVSKYISIMEQRSAYYEWPEVKRPGNDIVKLNSVRIVDQHHNTQMSFKVTEQIGIEMKYEIFKEGQVLWLGHNIFNQFAINVFDTHSINSEYYSRPHPTGEFTSVVWIPENLLNTGSYHVGCAIFNHSQHVVHFHEKETVLFKVYEATDELTARGSTGGEFPGVIRPLLKWSIYKL